MADIEAYMGERLICVWNDEQTAELIRIWGNESVQAMLNTTRRNSVVYKIISDGLRERGIDRTAEQCRSKIKNLKKEYNHNRKNGTSTCRFFEQLDEILGGVKNTDSVLTLDPEEASNLVPTETHQPTEGNIIHVVQVSEDHDHGYSNPESTESPVPIMPERNMFEPGFGEVKERPRETRKRKRSPERRISDILKDVTDRLLQFEKERDERMMAFIREQRELAEVAQREDTEREERMLNFIFSILNKS